MNGEKQPSLSKLIKELENCENQEQKEELEEIIYRRERILCYGGQKLKDYQRKYDTGEVIK